MIISHYFSTDFTLDLIMAVPFFTILRFQKVVKYDYKLMYNERYSWLKILMCLKAFKIFKLNHVKNNRVVYYFNRKFSKNYFVEKIYQMFNFILLMLSMFNFIICLHIYMAEQSYPNWIVETNLQNKSFFDVYFASFYFIIATMTSVGYGDITCVSMEETYFQIILLTIGLVAYSFIISTVGDYVKNQSRANMNYNRDMNKLEEIRIAYPNMPFKLYKKIQQHIRRTLTQSKKYEYNILINSLPYYLQNSILLQIHKNEINNFRFFKHCDNSDFILKVLTHFIPIFSKQNIVLVGEGELFENIFFVKNGRLCLEAIIDLDEIKYSIEKYLKYRFEEIDQIDELLDHENSLEKSRILSKSFRKGKVKNLKKLMEIITKQFEHIDDLAYMHESTIEQEIGQVDFHQEIHDFYKGNIKYIEMVGNVMRTRSFESIINEKFQLNVDKHILVDECICLGGSIYGFYMKNFDCGLLKNFYEYNYYNILYIINDDNEHPEYAFKKTIITDKEKRIALHIKNEVIIKIKFYYEKSEVDNLEPQFLEDIITYEINFEKYKKNEEHKNKKNEQEKKETKIEKKIEFIINIDLNNPRIEINNNKEVQGIVIKQLSGFLKNENEENIITQLKDRLIENKNFEKDYYDYSETRLKLSQNIYEIIKLIKDEEEIKNLKNDLKFLHQHYFQINEREKKITEIKNRINEYKKKFEIKTKE
jgi:hypothetical protein